MNIQDIEKLGTYEVVLHEDLPDIHAEGWILRHKKTGARVMLIPADDDNKVFSAPRPRTRPAWPTSTNIPCCAVPKNSR